MRTLDRALQAWRISRVGAYLRPSDRVLDIGCLDGALFRAYPSVAPSVGLDPVLLRERRVGPAVLRPGLFPQRLLADEKFDAIVALAVLEHVVPLDPFVAALYSHLVPGGLALLTVPEPIVDRILDVLLALRLADGMSAEEHHGYDVETTERLFAAHGFEVVAHERFQLGLNHFFAFRRPREAG